LKNRERVITLVETYMKVTNSEHFTTDDIYDFIQDHHGESIRYMKFYSKRELARLLRAHLKKTWKKGRKTYFSL